MTRRFTTAPCFGGGAGSCRLPARRRSTAQTPQPRKARDAASLAGLHGALSSSRTSAPIPPSRSIRAGTNMTASCPTGARPGSQNEIARLRSAIAAALGLRSAPADPRAEVRARLSDRPRPRRRCSGSRPPISRTPTRLIIWTTGSIRRSTSPGPMRRPETRLRAYHRLSARRSRARRGRSAPICARRCRSASSIMASRRSAASPNIIRATAPRLRRGPRSARCRPSCATRSRDAARAMQGLADWLESQRRTATTEFRARRRRASRRCSATPRWSTCRSTELEAIGRADLARNQQALQRGLRAATRPARRIPDCMDADERAQAGGRPGRRRAARSSPGLRAFIVRARSRHASPAPRRRRSRKRRPTTGRTRAYIDIPGPYESGLPSVYYIAPPDPSWTPEVQAGFVPGEADLLFTSVHEVWPGHFLNFLHANRSPFTLRPGVRRLCLRRGLGALYRGDDVGRRARRRRPRDPYRPALQRAAARLPLPLGDRHAHRPDDAGAVARRCSASNAIRTKAMPGSRRRAAPTIRPISTTRWAS